VTKKRPPRPGKKTKRTTTKKSAPPQRRPSAPPKRPRGVGAKGVRGMTPREVAAWRKREIAERAKEAKARQEYERAKKPQRGRPKGKKRLLIEATRAVREQEVRQQQRERQRRSRAGGKTKGRYRASKSKPQGLEESRRSRRGGVEKTLLRFKGLSSGLQAVDALLAMKPGTRAMVQLGGGYNQGATWLGSRWTTPQDASTWLQGIGLKYSEKIFGNKADVEELYIEVIGYRRYGENDDDDEPEDDGDDEGNAYFALGDRRR